MDRVFILSSKSRQFSLDRLFSGLYLRQKRVERQETGPVAVLSKNLSEVLFPVFFPVLSSCLKHGPEKSLFRETCLDFEFRNKKNLSVSLFFRDRLPSPVPNLAKNEQLNSAQKGRDATEIPFLTASAHRLAQLLVEHKQLLIVPFVAALALFDFIHVAQREFFVLFLELLQRRFLSQSSPSLKSWRTKIWLARKNFSFRKNSSDKYSRTLTWKALPSLPRDSADRRFLRAAGIVPCEMSKTKQNSHLSKALTVVSFCRKKKSFISRSR